MLKKMPDYGDATPLHIGGGISVKCPSGLLSAYFLAINKSFHHSVCLERSFGEGNLNGRDVCCAYPVNWTDAWMIAV